MMKLAKLLALCFFINYLLFIPAKADKLLSVDKENNKALIEIEGVEYELDFKDLKKLSKKNLDNNNNSPTISDQENLKKSNLAAENIKNKFIKMSEDANKYTGLPKVLGTRLYTQPTDRLVERGHFTFDLNYRASTDITEDALEDLFGIDSKPYFGIGAHYGLTDWLEIHGQRSNLTDAYEAGFKMRILNETRKFSLTNPFNVTVNAGFQRDSIQSSIDPYVQLILSRSIIPNRVQIYLAPIYAWRTSSIDNNGEDDDGGIFFTSIDDKRRSESNQGTFAIPVGLSIELVKERIALVGEIVPILNGFYENNIGWSTAIQILSRRQTHIWTIGVSNMPYVTTGQYIVGGPSNEVNLGFNLTIFF